ncbi:arsenite efflux transporter metallochaperone ArsD [Loigolactobacillus zhaoyuanensis]|uniref:Arsenite efflux transporter metallochaperone ArsD n=1 Tax=Loigolactobacillus zhaoyuanensis TaxID=2486017 RepID=A0ABW8UF74_9LACO|nr:arsenite efflux transporter metallochaperone ArsD [Loigolactobacillus zhaoyuanensis]
MTIIKVFEAAQCCASGICGSSISKELIQTTAIQRHVNAAGKNQMERYNLAQNPDVFVQEQQIAQLIKIEGIATLPVTMIDGKIVKKYNYPTFQQFSDYLQQDLEQALVH